MAQPLSRPPRRWATARHPLIYEINTWPWLTGLHPTSRTAVDLATVPPKQWDAIADLGFDAVWLMGVWERSPAGVAVALADDGLVESFRSALPDWVPGDVVGSPYCIRRYEVDRRLGGRAGLAVARSELARRGLGLILDFVPNHVAPDHPWTFEHPEFFIHGTTAELRADPGSFADVDGAVLAKGRDPYFPAWSDVLQLNVFSRAMRAAAVDTLRDVAEQCDGVRCDMAMLVVNDVFAGTWGDRAGEPPPEDYWPQVLGAVRRTHPDVVFIAEAYWDMEGVLQQQGFDFCYDKRLYDRLVDGGPEGVRQHLRADVEFQDRLLRFVENHDESRAAALFDPVRAKAVAIATLTQAGARLVQQGQIEGLRVHLPVFLGRAPREDGDGEVASFYRELLQVLRDSTFRRGHWRLCQTSDDGLAAWCWDGDRRWVVIVNLGEAPAFGWVRLPWADLEEHAHRLVDPIAETSVACSGLDLRDGLHVELGPWQWHVFTVEQT